MRTRSKNGLREIAEPFVVAAPSGARIRSSLRVSSADHEVLWAVGTHLGSLAGRDLAVRCALGCGPKHKGRTERKQALTSQSSSRWAGAITRTSADQWERALKNLLHERASLRSAVRTISQRLTAPVGEKAGKAKGYPTRAERFHKQRRLQVLQARLAEVEGRIENARVRVVRGGARLARNRHHLTKAGLTQEQWRQRWEASRLFLCADGEADKAWGNETIRVHPEEGWLEIRLPSPLAYLTNTPGRAPTYRLTYPVHFTHRADEWAAQAVTGAVRYDITFDPARQRWYVDASWQTRPEPPPKLEEMREHRTLAVDLNDGHLAAWALNPDGNPIGQAITIPTILDGPTSRRDGQLRAAITALLDVAEQLDCLSISIENLNLADARATGRETMGRGSRGRRFRRTVAGLPTGRFRTRLVGMAYNRGLSVIAVDPVYTSNWGGQHWQRPLTTSHTKSTSDTTRTRHHAAAVVIGRRSLGHHARRRTRTLTRDQRISAEQGRSSPNVTRDPARPDGPGQPATQPPDGTRRHLRRTGSDRRRKARNRSGPVALPTATNN
jgi:hypothetical protein